MQLMGIASLHPSYTAGRAELLRWQLPRTYRAVGVRMVPISSAAVGAMRRVASNALVAFIFPAMPTA